MASDDNVQFNITVDIEDENHAIELDHRALGNHVGFLNCWLLEQYKHATKTNAPKGFRKEPKRNSKRRINEL